MSSYSSLSNQVYLWFNFLTSTFCSLSSHFWSWILSILTLAFLIGMPLMIELPLKVLKLHSSMRSNIFLSSIFAYLWSSDCVSFCCCYLCQSFCLQFLFISSMIIIKINNRSTTKSRKESTLVMFISSPKIAWSIQYIAMLFFHVFWRYLCWPKFPWNCG